MTAADGLDADGGQTRESLLATRRLLRTPDCSTQWAAARTAAGLATHPLDPQAVAWSLLGAVQLACTGARRSAREPVIELLSQIVGGSLDPWNDLASRSHADVLTVLDAALASPRGAAARR